MDIKYLHGGVTIKIGSSQASHPTSILMIIPRKFVFHCNHGDKRLSHSNTQQQHQRFKHFKIKGILYNNYYIYYLNAYYLTTVTTTSCKRFLTLTLREILGVQNSHLLINIIIMIIM